MSMIDDAPPPEDLAGDPITPEEMFQPPPRPRRRLRSLTVDKTKIASRVVDFYTQDLQDRSKDRERRIQRYAKFRMWSEEKSWPWQGSSNIGLPDMMEKSLRVQDTLHNAVMGSRPAVIGSKSVTKDSQGKEETIDKLIDFQMFVENDGETKIGDLIESYVNDGCFTCFTPWVKEKREVCERMEFKAPEDPATFFDELQALVDQMYPGNADLYPINAPDDEGANGWNWCVHPTQDEKVVVSFYTEDDDNDDPGDKLFAVVKKYVIVHDGPVPIPMDYDDVLYPAGVGNLQIPGPANPSGSPHVILRSSPTIDEVKRLAQSGYYDLLTPEDIDKLQPIKSPRSDEMKKDALDQMQGQNQTKIPDDRSQGTVTRLLCFDRYDLDGDGLAEDVVFWVLVEPNVVCRARYLSEEFPAKVPRRPLSEATFVPASGRREGISLLEIQEGIHDCMKMLYDITQDSGVLGALPVFFYRMAGALKPETLALFPGMGIPVGDPQRDVNFPNVANTNALGMLLNLISIVGTWGDRATMIGEFQLGRVPAGKSSALRTTGSVSMLQAQGDARPERILRRFFVGLTQLWANIHDLNCAFLPRDKQIRISGLKRPDEDPFLTIEGREKIDGVFRFEFKANAFNTDKGMMQQALMQVAGAYLSPLGIQAGIVTPDNIYALFRDLGKAFGLEVEKYLTTPTAEASMPLITAQDAITALMQGQMPYGKPAEGTQAHMEFLVQFTRTPEFGLLKPPQVLAFTDYVKQLMERLMAEQAKQAMMEAAAQYQQGGQGQPANPGGAPTQNAPSDPNAGPPQVSGGNELMDETLPGAGGGGQEEMAT